MSVSKQAFIILSTQQKEPCFPDARHMTLLNCSSNRRFVLLSALCKSSPLCTLDSRRLCSRSHTVVNSVFADALTNKSSSFIIGVVTRFMPGEYREFMHMEMVVLQHASYCWRAFPYPVMQLCLLGYVNRGLAQTEQQIVVVEIYVSLR